jgi:hypothetical protein
MNPPAAAAAEGASPVVEAHLSTDYLNRYSEALMLIEMASLDPEIAGDLREWRPVSYAEHFAASTLRCAPSALAAWRGLDSGAVHAFEELCAAMNRLIATVTLLLSGLPPGADPALVVDAASGSLRGLLARANDFIISNGQAEALPVAGETLQDMVDALMAA